jgi:dTDP-4-dehydrorhamnose reductase
MPKSILITGAHGQVGSEIRWLVEQGQSPLEGAEFLFRDRDTLDILDQEALRAFMQGHGVDTIINCAGYTAVDRAEEQEELAYAVNRDGVANLAQLAKEAGVRLLHISTDYVFSPTKHTPFNEEDETNPEGVYGKSKLAGEEVLRAINPPNALIVRTSWVYSSFGENFVKTMLRLGKSRKELGVVYDQVGTPTYARDLARTLLDIVAQGVESETVGLYNYSNEGACSWYDFAESIFEITQTKVALKPIPTSDYPTPAKRPCYSVLDKSAIKRDFGITIPYWRDSLKACLEILHKQQGYQSKIGIIGSGFIASGLAKLLTQHEDFAISAILTRSPIDSRSDFAQHALLTNDLEDLLGTSDLIVECSGDAIYATETIKQITEANIPVVTMNSEFHVTTGSYFVGRGLVTEAEGDQPGVQAILHEEALAMGFKPLLYANIKGFLNENPTKEDMLYWGGRSNLSLEMVTSFTDGTKVSIEQVLVANGLGANLIEEGLVKLQHDDMLEGGTALIERAKSLGVEGAVSDYLLSSTLPAGVFLVVGHDEDQQGALQYYKLGQGPYYVIDRTYHLCHLEIIKTIKRVLSGGGVLLDNSATPRYSVGAVAKRDISVGEKIEKAIGSFSVRGSAIAIANHPNHVPIGLLADAQIVREVKEGEMVTFDDVILPPSLALDIWQEILSTSTPPPLPLHQQ